MDPHGLCAVQADLYFQFINRFSFEANLAKLVEHSEVEQPEAVCMTLK
jgi:hypothetical protein